MPVLDTIKSMLGKEERTFTYECQRCERVFESPSPSSSQASCPECTDSQTTPVPGQSADDVA